MARVIRKAGVVYSAYFISTFEHFSNLGSVLAGSFHPKVKCLDAPEYQEAVLRARDSANGILEKVELLSELIVASDQSAQDHIRVAAQVLGSGVQDNISAQIQRVLEVRRGKGVVHAA
jgi:hypothetical protein